MIMRYHSVRCRQLGRAPLRLSLRAGFLEKREKGRTPVIFGTVRNKPALYSLAKLAHPPESLCDNLTVEIESK
jgi:hypothetical protein